MDYWTPKHVELLNVMKKINHQILCILLDYRYIPNMKFRHNPSCGNRERTDDKTRQLLLFLLRRRLKKRGTKPRTITNQVFKAVHDQPRTIERSRQNWWVSTNAGSNHKHSNGERSVAEVIFAHKNYRHWVPINWCPRSEWYALWLHM